MNSNIANTRIHSPARDWETSAAELAHRFGQRAAEHDERGAFVAANYMDLRDHGFFSAGIPEALGGGGADFSQLCSIVRIIGQHCASTALAFAMHSHTVAANVFKYRNGDQQAAGALARIAGKNLVLATTGANDWVASSGTAEAVEGGFRVTAHKRFVSGISGADLFASSAVLQGEKEDEVLHFVVPIGTEGLQIVETWNALGMRGTGSNDVKLDSVFIPDSAVTARRPAGAWHPMWNVVIPCALPLITAAYLGLAETAAGLALQAASHRGSELSGAVGEMTNSLSLARILHGDMLNRTGDYAFTPSLEMADAILQSKTLLAGAVKHTVELAAELVGGPGFSRGHPMERIVRDVRAMHYHPLPARRQQEFSGRIALGLPPFAAPGT